MTDKERGIRYKIEAFGEVKGHEAKCKNTTNGFIKDQRYCIHITKMDARFAVFPVNRIGSPSKGAYKVYPTLDAIQEDFEISDSEMSRIRYHNDRINELSESLHAASV